MDDLTTDPEREGMPGYIGTGIFIRAIGKDGKWGTFDIAELDKPSLEAFAKSRGEVSDWAMGIINIMLGWV